MKEHKVARLSELGEGQMQNVEVGDTTLLLSNVEGKVYAVSGKCTHYGAPLADGALSGSHVICPWHHACFDVTNGAHIDPPGLGGLTRFDVRVEGDDVYVEVPGQVEAERPPKAQGQATEKRTFVVLGGGIAGENAAEVLRDEGFAGRLVMVSKEAAPPYDRTKLSKNIGSADDAASLHLRDASFYEERDIERLEKTVTKVDADAKQLSFEDGSSLRYDALLVATGSAPRQIGIDGADLEGVFQLRTLQDAQAILSAAKKGDKAVLIGSSFIALELASSLKDQEVAVSVVAPESVPFENILGERVGKKVQSNHEKLGTTFYLGHKPEAFMGEGSVAKVVLDDGTELAADFVVVGIGVTPETDMITGVSKTDDGGVEVDEYLKAADDLYAAGDIAAFPLAGERVRIEHWRLAAQHGRTAARNMLGQDTPYDGVPYFWTAQPDLQLRYVGHAESFDDIVYDGDVEAGEFIAYYLKDGAVRAAVGAGRDKDLAALEHLIKQGKTPSPDDVKRGIDLLAQL